MLNLVKRYRYSMLDGTPFDLWGEEHHNSDGNKCKHKEREDKHGFDSLGGGCMDSLFFCDTSKETEEKHS